MILIEKDPIMKFIQDGLNNKHYGHVGVEIITEVEYSPEIDAVPVVRCEDCVMYDHAFQECRYFQAITAPLDYCAEGKRMGEDNEE